MGKNERQAYLRIWTLLYFQIFIDVNKSENKSENKSGHPSPLALRIMGVLIDQCILADL
jgi:hypothetical protein